MFYIKKNSCFSECISQQETRWRILGLQESNGDISLGGTVTVTSPPTVLLVSSKLSDFSWPRRATAVPSVLKPSMLLVDSSSSLGLPEIGPRLTSRQSAGGKQETGLDWEDRVKPRGIIRRGGESPTHRQWIAHTHIWQSWSEVFLGFPPTHFHRVSQRANC